MAYFSLNIFSAAAGSSGGLKTLMPYQTSSAPTNLAVSAKTMIHRGEIPRVYAVYPHPKAFPSELSREHEREVTSGSPGYQISMCRAVDELTDTHFPLL